MLGVTPLVVLSGSMSGDAPDHIEVGDLVFVTSAQADEMQVGDIIAYMEDAVVVTHRIIEIRTGEDGGPLLLTKGDANNSPDRDPVTVDRLVGVFVGRLPKLGDFALFMQTTLGMVLFVGVSLLALVAYDMFSHRRYDKRESAKTAELEAELERLRALAGEKDTVHP